MGVPKKARGRPFKIGNPGRPPGARNKTSRLVEQLAEGHAEQLMQKAVDMALEGDVACLRMVLDRVSPPRKDRPVDFDTSPLKTPEDVLEAISSIWAAVGDGRLTPAEAGAIVEVLERSNRIIEFQGALKRLEVLEEGVSQDEETIIEAS